MSDCQTDSPIRYGHSEGYLKAYRMLDMEEWHYGYGFPTLMEGLCRFWILVVKQCRSRSPMERAQPEVAVDLKKVRYVKKKLLRNVFC
jgi:hypothetical protein